MGLYLEHVNNVLVMNRKPPVEDFLVENMETDQWRAQKAVQYAVQKIWHHKQWSFRKRETTFDTVATVEKYRIPSDVGQIRLMRSSSSMHHIVSPVDEVLYNKLKSNNTTLSAAPRIYRLTDVAGIHTQLTEPSVITVESTSSADNSGWCFISGLDTNGRYQEEMIYLLGTSPVSSVHTYKTLFTASKNDKYYGAIGETEGHILFKSAAATLVEIPPNEVALKFQGIGLYPIPDAAYTITLFYYSSLRPFKNRFSDSLIPTRWDAVVDQWAHFYFLQGEGQAELTAKQDAYALANQMLSDMTREDKPQMDPHIHIGAPGAGLSLTGGLRAEGSYADTFSDIY